MSKAQLPPVPPGNRSPQGSATPGKGEADPPRDKNQAEDRDRPVDQTGQTANTIQNTNHQGRRQDR